MVTESGQGLDQGIKHGLNRDVKRHMRAGCAFSSNDRRPFAITSALPIVLSTWPPIFCGRKIDHPIYQDMKTIKTCALVTALLLFGALSVQAASCCGSKASKEAAKVEETAAVEVAKAEADAPAPDAEKSDCSKGCCCEKQKDCDKKKDCSDKKCDQKSACCADGKKCDKKDACCADGAAADCKKDCEKSKECKADEVAKAKAESSGCCAGKKEKSGDA
jgi:hypothetical protein